MSEGTTSNRSGRRLRWALVFAALAIVFVVGLAAIAGSVLLPGILKRSILESLRSRFEGDVEIRDLRVTGFPRIIATAQSVVIRMRSHPDPPVITIQKLTLSASPLTLLRRHVSSVDLERLEIRVPAQRAKAAAQPRKKIRFPLVIDRITANEALLETLPGDSKHVPRDFEIHRLLLESFSFENPALFQTILRNPQPAGEIESEGQFGPWQAEEPGETPVSGTFRYSHADFSSIKGLSGIMSSKGSYSGTLDEILVQGDTEMPDFALTVARNPMPLTTHYVAIVDGTNGNTYLQSVDARLGKSAIHVSGEIVGVPGAHGRKIALEATSKNARVEDLIHLAVKGPSPLKGTVNLRTTINLPPVAKGKVDTVKVLALNGQFDIADARFTNPSLQGRVDALSRAGRGLPKRTDIRDVGFHLQGKFLVGVGVAHLSRVGFDIEGASVQMDGSYGLDGGALDFQGIFSLDAKASQATTGMKSILLKVVDPLFAKHGKGFSIPFTIGGDRDHPAFRPGLGLGR